MDTYLCDDDGNLRVRLITKPHTRKAGELRRGNEVTVTYHDPRDQGDNGYAALSGAVRELTDAARAVWPAEQPTLLTDFLAMLQQRAAKLEAVGRLREHAPRALVVVLLEVRHGDADGARVDRHERQVLRRRDPRAPRRRRASAVV